MRWALGRQHASWVVEQTLRNWVKFASAGKLNAAGAKPITPEQMELSRLRAENASLKMHVEILNDWRHQAGRMTPPVEAVRRR